MTIPTAGGQQPAYGALAGRASSRTLVAAGTAAVGICLALHLYARNRHPVGFPALESLWSCLSFGRATRVDDGRARGTGPSKRRHVVVHQLRVPRSDPQEPAPTVTVYLLPTDVAACERFLRQHGTALHGAEVLGLDAEWPPAKGGSQAPSASARGAARGAAEGARSRHVALLQLSTLDACYLLQLGMMHRTPPALQRLLADRSVAKGGVGIAEDVARLEEGHDLKVEAHLDVRRLATHVAAAAPPRGGSARHPGALQGLGLRALAAHYLGVQLDKAHQCSDWSAPELSWGQIQYAALDAWASVRLVHCLHALHCECEPAAPTPSPTARPPLGPLLQALLGAAPSAPDTVRSRGKQRRPKGASGPPTPAGVTASASAPAAGGPDPAPTAHQARERRKDASVRLPTRKTVLYENCRILAPDGAMLCTCGRKKVAWYIQRGLATLEREEPPTIRLTFEPQGRTHADDLYYLAEKQNLCCCCGHAGDYLRHSVVPHCYRHHFPEEMKSHLSHDIVLLCPGCHRRASSADHARMQRLAEEHAAPLEGGAHVRSHPDPNLAQVRSSARALLKFREQMPPERAAELLQVLRNHFGVEEVTDAELAEGAGLQAKVPVQGFVGHAPRVVQNLIRAQGGPEAAAPPSQGELVPRPPFLGSEAQWGTVKGGEASSLTAAGRAAIQQFVVDWRKHFVASMSPQHLPPHWDVHARVCNSSIKGIDLGGGFVEDWDCVEGTMS